MVNNETREQCKSALADFVQIHNNIRILEKTIYEKNKHNEDEYKNCVYEVIGDISDGIPLSEIYANLRLNNIGWNHKSMEKYSNIIKEQDDFIKHPFEVEDGVIECRCGSKRVFSYSKQCRKSDESITTFAQCVSCKAKWTYSG